MTEVHLDKFIRQGNDPFRRSYKEYASMDDQTRPELRPLCHVQLLKKKNQSQYLLSLKVGYRM